MPTSGGPAKPVPVSVSCQQVAGTAVLVVAVVLYSWGMWSPYWSSFEKEQWKRDESRAYGPWLRDCSHNSFHNKFNWYDIPGLGTGTCDRFVDVADSCDYIVEKVSGINKCTYLSVIRWFTFIAMVLGFVSLILSSFAIAMPYQLRCACLASCIVALVAAFLILISICMWAAIKDWERQQMRYNCKDQFGKWKKRETITDHCNIEWVKDKDADEWEDLDPPYGLDYSFVLVVLGMLCFCVGGPMVAAGGYRR